MNQLDTIAKEILFCKACDSLYSEDNKPFILNCGNTLCSRCVQKYTKCVINKSDPSCHFEENHHHILEDVPVNYLFLNLIQNFKSNYLKKQNLKEEELEDHFKPGDLNKTFEINHMDFDCSFIRKIEQENQTGTNRTGEIEFTCKEFYYKGQSCGGQAKGRGLLKLYSEQYDYTVFEGEFQGFQDGKGKITYYSGEVYEGAWKNMRKEGKGRYESNEVIYEGNFKNDFYQGYGELREKSTNKIMKGNFKEGKEDGEFLIYHNISSYPMKVLYKNGSLISILEMALVN
jgi:hypothetical protein